MPYDARLAPASWRLPWRLVSLAPAFARGSSGRFVFTFCLTCAALLAATATAAAQTGRNVLLVVNAASPASAQIGDHYIKTRGIPADQIIKLTLAAP